MTIIVGQIATSDGLGFQPAYAGQPMLAYRSAAGSYNHRQPSRIGVDIAHEPGTECGQVVYLCQRQLGLFGVAEIDDQVGEALPDDFYLSGEIEGRYNDADFADITLTGVAIVPKSATVGKSAAHVVVGGLDDAHLFWANEHHRKILKEAADYQRSRRGRPSYEEHYIAPLPMEHRDVQHLVGGGVLIDGEPAVVAGRGAQRVISVPDGRGGSCRLPIEIRPGGKILSVR